jgi:hypothetical protein
MQVVGFSDYGDVKGDAVDSRHANGGCRQSAHVIYSKEIDLDHLVRISLTKKNTNDERIRA